MRIDAQFPAKLKCLFEPHRYKVLYGGRGAGRSWGVARWLLMEGMKRTISVLCARELQLSIEESVHKLLSEQIDAFDLHEFYTVQKAHIIGRNGTVFSFAGIKNNTKKIKSFEGIDYCWVEEANGVSKASWNVLIPTIRKKGSEIIITFNPELETDYTYVYFVKNPPANAVVVKMTYADNPYFPDELKAEMEHCRQVDPDEFMNVWEGHCRQNLDGAVYAKELRLAQEEGRITKVPYEHESPVLCFWDLGRADRTAIWFGQRVSMEYRYVDYYDASGEDIYHFMKVLQERNYLYGGMYLPHDAKAKQLGSRRTIEEIVRASYPSCTFIVPKLSIADGINAARIIFPNCYFDEDKCEEGIKALRHYRYKVVSSKAENGVMTQFGDQPLHDWASNGADAFRYSAVAFHSPRQEHGGMLERLLGQNRRKQESRKENIPSGLGWMS